MSNIYNTEPANGGINITPSDSVILPAGIRALDIGTGGDVALRCPGSNAILIFKNRASGSILPVKTGQVMATGTTATDIIGLF